LWTIAGPPTTQNWGEKKNQKKQPCTVYGSGINFEIFWEKKVPK
jgi:hypothetical protein